MDLIAAEDTRHSIKLLNHFDIKTPMTSYHEYNKVEKARYLVEQMKAGVNIALITDAGTPGISDPGEELVRQCHEAGIKVTSLRDRQPVLRLLPCQDFRPDVFVLRLFYHQRKQTEGAPVDSGGIKEGNQDYDCL